MQPGSTFRTILQFVGRGRRRTIVVGVLVAAVLAGVVIPLTLGGGAAPAPAKIFGAESCADAPAIDAPSGAKGGGDWQKLAVPERAPCATLTPSARDAGGIPQNASFVLASAQPIQGATLGRRITVTPPVAFDVRPETPTRHRLVPRSPLAASTIYRFTLLDSPGGRPVTRWAFQTHGSLRVVETLPRDEATDVPLNLGIELTFSHDGVGGVEQRFSISPKTAGRFETHKRVVVFVPKSLKPRTLYTVRLRPGAGIEGTKQKIAEPVTFRFETGSAERDGGTPGAPALEFGRAAWESAVKERPVVSVFFSGGEDETAPKSVPFTVFRYNDVDHFLAGLGRFVAIPAWAGHARGAFVAPTKGLTKIATFPGRLERLGAEGDYYVRFPELLAPGFYLVRTQWEGVPAQTWLQVTDLATYAALSEDRTLVWVNDLATKKPIPGATLNVAGGKRAAATGADGTASFPTPRDLLRLRPDARGQVAEVAGNLIVTAPDGRIAAIPLADLFAGYHSSDFREYTFSGDPTPYWRFLYADRQLYRLNDTVRFWGLVRARAGARGPRDVTIEMISDFDPEGGAEPVAATTVRTTSRGTFIGELPFAAAAPGYYQLIARVGDQTIASTSFEVEDFVKPAYKIDVVPTKSFIVSGESTRFDITAAFFEGSPVPNMELSYEIGYEEQSARKVTTDAQGRASVPYRKRTSELAYDELRAFPSLAEEGEITGSAPVTIYPSTLDIGGEALFVGKRVRVDGTVFAIDFDRLNADDDGDDPGDIGPPAPGRRVTGVVTEISYRRIEEGETYDFVAKIVRKRYRYEEVRRPVGTFSARTDERGRYSFSFSADPKKSYDIDLSVDDSAGRTATASTFASSSYNPSNPLPDVVGVTDGPYEVGDQVSVVMRTGLSGLPSGGANRYLFYKAARGIRESSVATTPRYSFRFREADVPNVTVIGVRFDGVTYTESIGAYRAEFDVATRELTIAVTPDRARYRPGETARLGVRVTDARGRPVRAEVLVSAVDEALFRVRPNQYLGDRNILAALYESVGTGVLQAYASHQYPRVFDGAESGGEGADRTDFRDVGIFTRVLTGADGRASAPFKLPDNLTSWRITTLAVTDDLKAGYGTTPVPVGLPVFADVGLGQSYLVADKPSVRMRAFGSELRAGDAVSFRVEFPTLSSKPVTTKGQAFRSIDVAMPPLREGTHRIRISVSARGRTDVIVRSFTVVPSRLVHVEAKTIELTRGQTFTPPGTEDGITTVVLSDRNRGRFYPALSGLSWTYGDRLDQMLARNLAQELLAKYFGEPAPFPALFHPSTYQTEGGGVAIFPFADDDLALSANAAALAPDRFGRQELARYFAKILADREETRERGIIALYGMASLGEQVLLDVQRAAQEEDLTLRERLYVALAALQAGDEPTARSIYDDVLRRHAQVRGATVRLATGVDRDDILEATSLAATLGARLADDAAAAMFDYVSENSARDIVVGLSQIAFLSAALPQLPEEPSRVAYTVAGKRQTRELSHGAAVTLTLTARQRAALALEVVDGTIGASSSYLTPFKPKEVKRDPDARITRTWDVAGTNGTRRVRDGDLIRITIGYKLGSNADDGCYQVTDLLPSGLRAVVSPYDRGIETEQNTVSYPYAVEGQRVSFCVSRGGRYMPIVYYARVIGLGTFTVEQALIQSQRAPGKTTLTGTFRVEIIR